MRHLASGLAALLLLSAPSVARAQLGTLMPVPTSVQPGEGWLVIDSTFTAAITRFSNDRLARAVTRGMRRLQERVTIPLATRPVRDSSHAAWRIEVVGAGMPVQGVEEDESYRLEVASSGVTLRAATVVGAMRGIETLLQLVTSDATTHYLPAVTIDDRPRFPWRGLLVDVGRHFMPVEQVKKTLDGMAMVKLNVLHWHLSEDQGFRVESKRFPKLHQLGSDGEYYTQEQLRDVVAYARDRGIRVVPEFDMPGHSTAWFVGYPQYTTRPGPISIRREWGGADAIFDPTREEVYGFIDRFIGEMVRIFPDAYWHIGGDEVEDKHWNANRRIVAWRRRRGFRNNEELQAYFNRRLTTILAKYHRRMIGWDEILNPRLPKQTVVQSWRGTNYLRDAAKAGFTSILSAPYYLDHIKPATDFYLADPVPRTTDLSPQEQQLVLGGEACMWSEFVSYETTDSRLWPRLGAVAERLWSPGEVTDVADMYRRLDILANRLEGSGIRVLSHSERMLRKFYPVGELSVLDTLLTVVQPPFFAQRLNGKSTNQLQPLTRLVDAARPDPPARWLTERLVRRFVVNADDSAAYDSLVTLFSRWRELAPRVDSLAQRATEIGDAVPVTRALERTSAIGLEALRHARAGTRPDSVWIANANADLKLYDAPQGLLRVVIVPDVRKLVALFQGVVQ
ncbi:MAG: family 20 glycosylhydrolase [Gemmatimonadaceae bacterium]|nr:family 20 glycosylhydrolase [Gemmatimonadaceae bacterium]